MPYQKFKNGNKIHLKVIPNASKNEICGEFEDEFGKKILKVKVAAVPDDGKANKALMKFLAKEWGVPPSSIEIVSGQTSRNKVLVVNSPPSSK